MSSFFSPDTPTDTSKDLELQWAQLLANTIRQKKRVTRPISINSWSTHFHKLQTIDKIPKEEINRVLQWYITHIGEEFVPEAYSAKGFRDKFASIVRSMERKGEQVQEVPITPEAQSLIQRLQKLHWSGIVNQHLPMIVQRSLINYKEFLRHLRILEKELSIRAMKRDPTTKKTIILSYPLLQFVRHVLNRHGCAIHFIENWMGELRDWVEFVEWNGNAKNLIFQVSSHRFQSMGCQWAALYCGSSRTTSLWRELMEELNKIKE